MVSISYGIGEVAGDFVRDAAASVQTPKLHVSAAFGSLHSLFDLVSCLRFVEQLIFMIGVHTKF